MVKRVRLLQEHPWIIRLKKVNYRNLAIYIILTLISYQFMYPLLRMISMTLMTEDDIINPIVNWIPQSMSLGNLRTALRVMNPRVTLFHSIWFSGIQALGSTLVAAMAGFAFARYEFPLKKFWFFMIIVAFILPTSVMMVPRTMMAVNFQVATEIQMIATPWPQILLAFGGQGVFSTILILIFYNFTRMIPPALDEAASIDGASSLQIFYHVILKLSLATLLVIFLLSFVWNWNETFITNQFLRPRADGISLMPSRLDAFEGLFGEIAAELDALLGATDEMTSEMQRLNEALRMSGTLISIIPLFILYLFVQKHFIKGIENTGLTGL